MLEQLLFHFGYIIVILGTFFAGEGMMIIFGYIAQSGFLNIYFVIIFGFFGSATFDISLFLIGYTKGEFAFKKIPGINQEKINNAKNLVRKYDTTYILFYRFIFGARLASILILGTSRVKISKFIIYNSIIAFMWVCVFSLGGYFLGLAFQRVINNLLVEIFMVIVILFFIIYFASTLSRLYQ